ncbi:GNAT family N-acetyltransferase [Limimaricola pyoseonensis]|uniref:Protein N-acetyltransferase, RimJ/RimL family n=1 Tax=Limimaricola pyoseonensis TaxID=521013 RepID=A0A1G7A2M3_9RHOB|nr:GNAT family N-acetyltransferase [Limimaricola pyoseonensis]SDE08991.1 Protein N-acetyltransferase, RimJ/RimL family [Limimaricola pyoseonensis]
MTELTTERLRLRPVCARDVDAIHAALQDIEVARWLSRVPYPYGRGDAEWFAGEVEAGRIPAHAVHDAEGFAGVIAIDPTLGYWFARDRWGRGYATEAGRAVLAAHFADPAAETVEAGYYDENEGSGRVLAKLGFEPAGPQMLPSMVLGHDVPGQKVRLTRQRWQSLQDEARRKAA